MIKMQKVGFQNIKTPIDNMKSLNNQNCDPNQQSLFQEISSLPSQAAREAQNSQGFGTGESLARREQFAVSLRRARKKEILGERRRKQISWLK